MVSYEDLIYNFVDIYLGTAMECSICKESYALADDTGFLDDYMKFFVSLLLPVRNDKELKLESVKEELQRKKSETVIEFQNFMKRKMVEAAIESSKETERNSKSVMDLNVYINEIQRFCGDEIDEKCKEYENKPVELLRYIRKMEETL